MTAETRVSKQNKQSTALRTPLWRRALKCVLLTVLAVTLFVGGIMVAAVSILTPDRLTPLVRRIADKSLNNAHMTVDTVRLGFDRHFTHLHLDIVNVAVISDVRRGLPQQLRDAAPAWADTVMSAQRISGGINIFALVRNRLSMSDVVIDRPGVNAVVYNDSVTNFDIMLPAPADTVQKPFDWRSLPSIRLSRFAMTNPRPLRYLDIATGTSATANITRAQISGVDRPLYSVEFGGVVQSPLLAPFFKSADIVFGLGGNLDWDQQTPWKLGLDGIEIYLATVPAKVSAALDFRRGLVVEKADMTVGPVDINRVLGMVPRQLLDDYGVPGGLETDAKVTARAWLTQPYNAGGTSLPHGRLEVVVPESWFGWQKTRFSKFMLDVAVDMPVDDLDMVRVDLRRLHIQSQSARLTVSGTVTNLLTDPYFDGKIKGTCNLGRLSPVIADNIPGWLQGRLTADAEIAGRPSMLAFGQLHRLHVKGNLALDDLYWLAGDTVNMVYAHRADLDFGTGIRFEDKNGHRADSLLSASVRVDSAAILHGDISMHVKDFKIGIGAKNTKSTNRARKGDVVPLGGGLHIGSFGLVMLTDSAGMRVRNVDGYTLLRAHGGDVRQPEVVLDLMLGRLSGGSRTTRMMVTKAKTHVTAWLSPQGRKAKRIRQIADSVALVHPHIAPDSVYALALEIHNRHRSKYPRVHPRYEADSTEIIYWGASNTLKRLLTEWRFEGSLNSNRASLFTPVFPVRNRMRNLDVTFNNDTVMLNSLQYKAGHSDFTLSGRISNVRRAFTSANYSSPLKVNLDVRSDTIDINQLAQTAFSGAAYAESAQRLDLGDIEDESRLEQVIGRQVQNAPDSLSPLLIPRNIEANLTVGARNVLYSDLLLHNMGGEVMVYRGAVNLHNLHAASDVGAVNLSALYDGRTPADLSFGMGLQLKRFNINRFLKLVPAVDSLMPLLRDFSGIISADIAAYSRVTPGMDLDLPTLDAAIKLEGDSLVLIDPDTFKSLARWLLFRKKENIIDHMQVQMLVRDNTMQMFPFVFDIDRYRLGVQGHNDFAMNFDYHIAVLKSPIPFKFGINIKGNPDKFKIRLGGAKFNEKTPQNFALVDTTRVNLVRNLQNVFRRGVDNARFAGLDIDAVSAAASIDLARDTLTHEDSVMFIKEGLIPAPDTIAAPAVPTKGSKKKGRKKDGRTTAALVVPAVALAAIKPKDDNDEE